METPWQSEVGSLSSSQADRNRMFCKKLKGGTGTANSVCKRDVPAVFLHRKLCLTPLNPQIHVQFSLVPVLPQKVLEAMRYQGQIHTCPMKVHIPLNLGLVTLANPWSEWRQHPMTCWGTLISGK